MPVDTPRSDYLETAAKWQRMRDCSGGRDTILQAGKLYVPELPGADLKANEAYRQRGNFYNAVSRTVQGLVGAIFQEAPEVSLPKALTSLTEDVTLTNVPLEMFAYQAGNEVMLMGRYGILLDMSATPSTSSRPYACGYRAEDIINWKVERLDGVEMLVMLVLREEITEPDPQDTFVDKALTQYRVFRLLDDKCVLQLYRKTEKDSGYVPYEDEVIITRRGVPLNFIPFVFMGAVHSTPNLEKPPLLDLADVNLGHWRNSVDHEYGLHLVALPTPWVTNVKGQSDGALKIGPSVVWELETGGQAGMLEFSGAGLSSLTEAMGEKKKQMATIGARMLEDSASVAETASAVRLRHSGEVASLKTVAGALEQALTLILQILVWWSGTDEGRDPDVWCELNKEFLNVKASPQEIQVALTALQAGEISYETWWELLTDGGWGREGVDAAEERKQIEKESGEQTDKDVKEPPDDGTEDNLG